MPSSVRTKDRSDFEQTLSRAVRDNLAMLQRTSEELYHAVADLVAACSSSRAINALPPMVRAQTAAAALRAALEVLSEFITASLRAMPEATFDQGKAHPVVVEVPEPKPMPTMPPRSIPTPMATMEAPVMPPPSIPAPAAEPEAAEVEAQVELSSVRLPESPEEISAEIPESRDEASAAAVFESRAASASETVEPEPAPFDLSSLPLEEQELHRRANRVAKVSMQDIQLIRPQDVRLGRQHKDLCKRLRHDLDKARKEYERRFGSILNHPVDYFHYWMVEILGAGDPEALGEYPYPSPVVRS